MGLLPARIEDCIESDGSLSLEISLAKSIILPTARNSLFHPLGSLHAEGPGSVGVR